jgi:L-2-hydroxyglutarate oxidase
LAYFEYAITPLPTRFARPIKSRTNRYINVGVPRTEAGKLVTCNKYDVVVIGGGIVGLATAMALIEGRHCSLLVLEAEDRLGRHQTGNNSGVIHAGLYYKPGSLKARLCAEGRQALYRFCHERGIRHERCGKVVVATGAEEVPALDELERRGRANGLSGLRRLSPDQIRELEPHVRGVAGLHVSETGIADYVAVAHAYADVVRENGGEVRTHERVTGVQARPGGLVLETTHGQVECGGLVNCGGLHSDRIARMCGVEPGVQIVPFRGEYYKLRPESSGLIRNLVYPVPDPRFPFLGVHFTRMIRGGVEAGPNAVLALARTGYRWGDVSLGDSWEIARFGGFWRMAKRYWRTGLGEVHRSFSKRAFLRALQRLLPELTLADLEPGGAGVRAQAVEPTGLLVDDFRIATAPRMVHVLNAPSPAATASIAIGQYIADAARRTLDLPRASTAA